MKAPVDAPDHGDTICCGSQLRSRLRIRCCPALQGEQAYDHLQVVQVYDRTRCQSAWFSNCLIFLTKQALINSENLSQLEFGLAISFEFAFVACDRAVSEELSGATEAMARL